MSDRRTEASAASALRLAADLLSALVVTKTLSTAGASAPVEDSLDSVLQSHPDLSPDLEQIAAVIATQAGLANLAAERLRRRDGDG